MEESNISRELFAAILKANAARPKTAFFSQVQVEWDLEKNQMRCNLVLPIKASVDQGAGKYVVDVPDFLEPQI